MLTTYNEFDHLVNFHLIMIIFLKISTILFSNPYVLIYIVMIWIGKYPWQRNLYWVWNCWSNKFPNERSSNKNLLEKVANTAHTSNLRKQASTKQLRTSVAMLLEPKRRHQSWELRFREPESHRKICEAFIVGAAKSLGLYSWSLALIPCQITDFS